MEITENPTQNGLSKRGFVILHKKTNFRVSAFDGSATSWRTEFLPFADSVSSECRLHVNCPQDSEMVAIVPSIPCPHGNSHVEGKGKMSLLRSK